MFPFEIFWYVHCWVLYKFSFGFCVHQQAKKSRIVPSHEVLDKSKGASCFGSSGLTQLLASYAASMQTETSLRVGIVGKNTCVNIIYCMFLCLCAGNSRLPDITKPALAITQEFIVL